MTPNRCYIGLGSAALGLEKASVPSTRAATKKIRQAAGLHRPVWGHMGRYKGYILSYKMYNARWGHLRQCRAIINI